MTILLLVANAQSAPVLRGLASACGRTGQRFDCFFTGQGVQLLKQADVLRSIAMAERAVVCEYSWERFGDGASPPIEKGSQTDNSAMTATARCVVSL